MLSIISRTPTHVHRLSSTSRPVSWASNNDESFAESMEEDMESSPGSASPKIMSHTPMISHNPLPALPCPALPFPLHTYRFPRAVLF